MTGNKEEDRTAEESGEENSKAEVVGESGKADATGSKPCTDNEEKPARSIEEVEKEYQDKIKQLEDRFLRLAAEFDNYKKRTARQYEEIIRSSNEDLIVRLLEVVDNFHRALDAAEKSSDYESLLKGMELIYQHFDELLKREGVERIEAVGQKFDPNLHDAMMQMDSDEYPEGTVVKEFAVGFKLNGKVIRHTRVAVSGGKAAPTDELQDQSE